MESKIISGALIARTATTKTPEAAMFMIVFGEGACQEPKKSLRQGARFVAEGHGSRSRDSPEVCRLPKKAPMAQRTEIRSEKGFSTIQTTALQTLQNKVRAIF